MGQGLNSLELGVLPVLLGSWGTQVGKDTYSIDFTARLETAPENGQHEFLLWIFIWIKLYSSIYSVQIPYELKRDLCCTDEPNHNPQIWFWDP